MNTSSFSTPLHLGKAERKRTDAQHAPASSGWSAGLNDHQDPGAALWSCSEDIGPPWCHSSDRRQLWHTEDLSELLHFLSPPVSLWQKCACILRNFLQQNSPGLICFQVSFLGFLCSIIFHVIFLQVKVFTGKQTKRRNNIVLQIILLQQESYSEQ